MRKIAQECWVQFATQFSNKPSPLILWIVFNVKHSNQIKSDEIRNQTADIFAPLPRSLFPSGT